MRRFQSPAEREAEGRAKGYSGTLEADLFRSEAKVAALAHPDPDVPLTYRRGPSGEIVAEDKEEIPVSKGEGFALWRYQMELRFLHGDDQDFDYSAVDQNDDYDDHAQMRRDEEERYFDAEEPSFADDETDGPRHDDRATAGQTGIQDF